MMISPEGYYRMNLDGKTKEEIEVEIRFLKQEIADLKYDIKRRPFIAEYMPTRSTMLECTREYLKRAIQAYKDVGGLDSDLRKLNITHRTIY
ncbi:MAG: hypothetical protein J6E46_10790 [Faecalicoccus sp.]|nr:hypothetical protein [Faecalicoccus sp.]